VIIRDVGVVSSHLNIIISSCVRTTDPDPPERAPDEGGYQFLMNLARRAKRSKGVNNVIKEERQNHTEHNHSIKGEIAMHGQRAQSGCRLVEGTHKDTLTSDGSL